MQIWKCLNYLLIRVDSVFQVERAETKIRNQAPTSLNAQIIYLHKFDLSFRQNQPESHTAPEHTRAQGGSSGAAVNSVFSCNKSTWINKLFDVIARRKASRMRKCTQNILAGNLGCFLYVFTEWQKIFSYSVIPCVLFPNFVRVFARIYCITTCIFVSVSGESSSSEHRVVCRDYCGVEPPSG